MPRRPQALLAVIALAASTGAHAASRTDTRATTCAALQALVARAGTVVLASSATAYEAVHRDGGACRADETGAPAYEPTSDRAACFAGWRCKQHDSDFAN